MVVPVWRCVAWCMRVVHASMLMGATCLTRHTGAVRSALRGYDPPERAPGSSAGGGEARWRLRRYAKAAEAEPPADQATP